MGRPSILKQTGHIIKAVAAKVRAATVQIPPYARQIPVVINNFNRLSTLVSLIESLEERGITNIVILDNDSTYPPLLEWYATSPYEVVHLGANLGFKAIWRHPEVRRRFCRGWYVYTDSDVMLSPECPGDVMEQLLEAAVRIKPFAVKVGLSIIVDDLPDCYANKNKVLEAEHENWTHPVAGGKLFRAPSDTTFALYRPYTSLNRSRAAISYRTAPPYSIMHLPWYSDSAHPTAEERYYTEAVTHPTSWTSLNTPDVGGAEIGMPEN